MSPGKNEDEHEDEDKDEDADKNDDEDENQNEDENGDARFFLRQIRQIYCCYSSSIAFVFVVQRSETRNNSSPELSSQWHASPNKSSRRADTSRSFSQAV